MRLTVFLLFALVWVPATASAIVVFDFSVTGVVRDADAGTPVAGASVTVAPDFLLTPGIPPQTTMTAVDGQYSTLFASGPYEMSDGDEIVFTGFAPGGLVFSDTLVLSDVDDLDPEGPIFVFDLLARPGSIPEPSSLVPWALSLGAFARWKHRSR